MASWTKEDEALEEKLIQELFDYLSQHDADNIKRAAAHAKTGLKEKFKDTMKEMAAGVIPGVGFARKITSSLDAMLRSAFGGAMLSTQSLGEETAPYNYLANLFSKVLRKNASQEEKKLFVKYFIGTYTMVASTVGGMGVGGAVAEPLGEVGAEGVKFAVEKGIDLAGDLVSSEVYDVVTTDVKKKDLIKGIRVGPIAWAVYLSGKPRNAQAPTSAIENCRLALRVILGLPAHKTQLADGARWRTSASRGQSVVTPRDVCELLSDSKGKNKMITGDVAKNFHKIASFSDFGKVDENYDPTKGTKDHEIMKYHIAYLQFILIGLGLKKCLESDIFVLE